VPPTQLGDLRTTLGFLQDRYDLLFAKSRPFYACLPSRQTLTNYWVTCRGEDHDDVKDAKPEPDLFSLWSQRLGIGPQDCFAVRDAVWMLAAKRGGMLSIGLLSGGMTGSRTSGSLSSLSGSG
jgi:phosphoglycolate phosphatase-like HAD superfamily hydrolase